MIYLKYDTDLYEYEIADIIRLFFKEEQTCRLTDDKAVKEISGETVLLRTWVENNKNCRTFILSIKGKDIKGKDFDTLIEIPEEGLREGLKLKKQYLKKELYKALSIISGKESPWGTLTGVRPSKIVHEMLENGYNEYEVLEKLQKNYLVSAKKANLLYEVAKTEKRILDTAYPDTVSLYIGIPFCTTRCLYCSFTSNSIDKCRHLIDGYLSALHEEMKGVKEILENNSLKLQSIYIGGGTPTSIDCNQLERLLELTALSFNTEDVDEYTFEAGRPDTINKEKLEIIKGSKVSRICINPQTMNDETLLAIGRNHTASSIREAFTLAREVGFNNINMDIITGLPGENLQMFENTLKEIGKLSPEAVTVHAMAVKRASRFKEEREKYKMISDQEASDMMDLAYKHAKNLGMHPYYLYRQKNILGNLENVGYSKPGYECIYNVQIMEEKQTIIALGAGAVTKVVYPQENRIERAFNVKNVEEYIKRIPEMLERKKKLLCAKGDEKS
ncbi:MAG TPA: coproporphyrinogen dehydrogenase HemZ [Clostridiaceae bacterium]|nr:coproporphyrinogen dehydrogenase HemZ [Clostridiaceae bacterium]